MVADTTLAPMAEKAAISYAAERPKAFVDAVVAIALTLLILPLMESVGEVAGAGEGTLSWLTEHSGQLVSFVLSFLLIAMFWMIHHRLFAEVHRVNSPLLWLLAAWMLTIVWLPVTTAITGHMPGEDLLARLVYTGSLVLTALVSLMVRLYLRSHPDLHSIDRASFVGGIAADLSLVLLFLLAMLLTTAFPVLGYWAFLVMVLSGPVQAVLGRMLWRWPHAGDAVQ